MAMDLEFTFERVNDHNIKDLVTLMKKVHNRTMSVAHYKKKLDTSYTGIINIGYFAYSPDGEVAAFYGVYPVQISSGSTHISACQSGDTITNPKYQRKGLFVTLAKLTYQLAEKNGIKIVFGFPNNNSSYAFFNKLNWERQGNFTRIIKKYNNPFKFYNWLHYVSSLKIVYYTYIKILLLFFRGRPFPCSDDTSNSLVIHRTREYFKYKLNIQHSYIFNIDGFNIWLKFDDGISIGDIEPFDIVKQSDKFEKALDKLTKLLGVDKITAHCVSGSFVYNLFKLNKDQTEGLDIGILFLDKNCSDLPIKFSFSDQDTF